VTAGDLVVYVADPLLMGGEMLIVGVTSDNRLTCEAVHYERESEDDAPPRAVFWPHEVELADRWARAA
jgi:hypothetical protein